MNAPEYYVIRALPVLFTCVISNVYGNNIVVVI